MFAKILSILIVGGLIAFSAYQIVQIVRTVKERKKAKSERKENDKQWQEPQLLLKLLAF